jgi:hypothetical protein
MRSMRRGSPIAGCGSMSEGEGPPMCRQVAQMSWYPEETGDRPDGRVADGCAAGVAATTRSRTNRLLTQGPPSSTNDGAPAVNDRGGSVSGVSEGRIATSAHAWRAAGDCRDRARSTAGLRMGLATAVEATARQPDRQRAEAVSSCGQCPAVAARTVQIRPALRPPSSPCLLEDRDTGTPAAVCWRWS